MENVYGRAYPVGAINRLHDALAAVCPIDGVSIGRWDNRETWRLDAKPEATQEQITMARGIMVLFEPWAEAPAPQEDLTEGEAGEPDAAQPEPPAYTGVLILPDELGARRFVVRGMIAEAKTVRTDALQEPGWKEELTSLRGWLVDDARTDVHALPAMTQDQRDRLSWLEGVESRISQIEAHAAALDRTARDASPDTLAAMAADISQGWPT